MHNPTSRTGRNRRKKNRSRRKFTTLAASMSSRAPQLPSKRASNVACCQPVCCSSSSNSHPLTNTTQCRQTLCTLKANGRGVNRRHRPPEQHHTSAPRVSVIRLYRIPPIWACSHPNRNLLNTASCRCGSALFCLPFYWCFNLDFVLVGTHTLVFFFLGFFGLNY